MSKFRQKIDYLLKHNKFFYCLFFFLGSAFFRFLGIFVHVNKKRILFTAHGRLYNDSPKAIYERLYGDPRFKGFQFYWGVENPCQVDIPGPAIKVQIDSFKYFIVALSSKYWITCVNIERGLKFKKKKCIFLNTWHGYPIKGDGISQSHKDDYSHINFFCVAGDFDKNYYKKCFSIREDSFLYVGFPRCDTLYKTSSEETLKIKKSLGVPENKKIILYAPTWRDSKDHGHSYAFNLPFDINEFKNKLSNEYVLILRLHPYSSDSLNIQHDDFVKDFSKYPNINDLLKASSLLISDYSGTFFEYSILEKPMICFAYDYEDYKVERGVSMDLNELFGDSFVSNEEELLKKIINLNYDYESKKTRMIKHKFMTYGGNATDQCISAVFKEIL